MTRTLPFILFIFSSLLLSAQVEVADDLFDNFEYKRAASKYSESDSLTDLQVRKYAFSLLQIRDYKGAEIFYADVVRQLDSNAVNFYYYGICLKNNEKFQEAKKQFQIAQKLDSTNFFNTLMLEKLDKIESVYERKQTQSAEATKEINSPLADYSPVWYKEGILYSKEIKHDDLENRTQLHFETDHGHVDELQHGTSERPLNVLVYAPCIEGRFGEPQIVAKSEDYHIGGFDIDESSSNIYFTKTNMKNWTAMKTEHPTLYMGKIDTVENTLINVEKVKIKKLPPESGSGHPAITKNGSTMFFVSDMPGGFGGSDIYFVEKDEKSNWSEPVNLGAKINTKGDELFPVLYSDSLLYYSSNGKVGYGGLDIFSVAFDQASFSDAEILSAPVNSGADDFGILLNPLNREEGFLVSNRFGGRGDDDIYKFQPLVKGEYSAGSTFDVITNPAIGCFLDSSQLALALDTIEIAEPEDTFNIIDSILQVELADTIKIIDSILQVDQEEPVAVTEIEEPVIEESVPEPTDQNPEIKEVSMDEAIYFNFDQSAITERSQLVVDKWLFAMKEDPLAEIMIKSYTDCRGSNEYNISLSWRRTKTIKEYLISSGIEHTRIASKSMGATNFINNCDRPNACLDKEHGLNRRSEIELINQ